MALVGVPGQVHGLVAGGIPVDGDGRAVDASALEGDLVGVARAARPFEGVGEYLALVVEIPGLFRAHVVSIDGEDGRFVLVGRVGTVELHGVRNHDLEGHGDVVDTGAVVGIDRIGVGVSRTCRHTPPHHDHEGQGGKKRLMGRHGVTSLGAPCSLTANTAMGTKGG